MQGPGVKLLPKRAGVFENGPESNRDACAVVGHIKEENSKGWIMAESGTFVPKASFEEVERHWDLSDEGGDK